MRRSLSLLLFLGALFCASGIGQTTNATLGGTVTDPSGALIPGVTITATNTQTGIVNKTVTNEAGLYQFPSLQTGTYTVRAELPGFQAQAREAALGISQQVRLNFALQVGQVAQSVDVNLQADTLIATTSASVGTVLPEYKVRDLPLATRNVLDLVNTTAGVQGSNFAGGRATQLNTTRDGIPVSDGRYDIGASTSTYVSPDLVEELRVIVAPADAEVGRGSGQIQMVTRSGTNQFHGSVFWSNRNSALNANTWNNNFKGVGKDFINGNQFGGRIAGPILKNKTFFFFLYDGQRFVTKSYFTGTVLTEQARLGNFRYFPGVQNANAVANSPTVDKSGTPILNGQPATPSSVSVFNKDPLRPGMDTSGWVQRVISSMPLPNDYTVGDGLNTAGIRWLRRIEGQDVTNGDGQDTNRNQYNVRIDHTFSSQHKASFSGSWERDWAENDQAGIANWPGGFNGKVQRKPRVFTGSVVSTLSPSLLNEFRFGNRKQWNYSWSSIWRPDSVGDAARAALPSVNGNPFYPLHVLFPSNIINNVSGAATRGQTSPLWDFTDTLSWTKGKHAFKGGVDVRFTSSRGFNGSENPDWAIFPVVNIGAGQQNAVTGINTTNFPGIIGSNITTAQNLLLDLNGSVSNLSLQFNVHSPTDQTFTAPVRVKDFHQNEWGAFVKDDWKIRSDLTLNVGIRYDFYGVPWEKSGLVAVPAGGNAGLYGLSAGALTQLQLVGKNSNHPDTLLYANDWNNFGPAVGFSWTLPWGGRDKTVVRGGYAVSYQGAASFNAGLNIASGNNPGLSYIQNLTTLGLSTNFYNLSSPNLPIPVPAPTTIVPLATEPLVLRINPLAGFDQDRVNPYIQNYHFEIQRELARNLTFEVRYIGSKGSKLYGGVSLNDVDIFNNGLLDAFNVTRSGGDSLLLDQMMKGLVLNPVTSPSLTGQGVIGTNTTASAALRRNTNFRTLIANGNVGQFASLLNTSTIGTNSAGGLIRNGGFPENFIVANPQYAAVVMNTNPGSSTYHALDVQVTKRLSRGFTSQFSYIWSRSLSDASGDGNVEYLDPRNHSLNHTLTTFHRTHDIRANGTFELPFGPNHRFLSSGGSLVTRLAERWQLGGIFSWTSGAPLTITASNSELTWTPVPGQIAIARTPNTPLILGDFPKSTGEVTPVAVGAYYFPGLTQATTDPSTANVTTLESLQSSVSNRSIQDAQGNTILANPAPGTVGTLGRSWIEGPGHIGLDMNLIKRVKIAEQKDFELRLDVVNILNTPYWPNPVVDINSPSFGRLTTTDVTGFSNADFRSGNRRFTFNARINF